MAYIKITGYTDEEFEEKVCEENKEVIEEFLGQSHLSKQTLKQYKSAVYIFAKWVVENKKNVPFANLKSRDALKFQNYLIDLGLSTSAIKFKRSVVSSLYNHIEIYWNDEYPQVRNIFNKAIPQVGNVRKKEKVPLNAKELAKIEAKLRYDEKWEMLAMFLVLYDTAGRRAEVIQLKSEIAEYDYFTNKKGEVQNFYLSHKVRGKGKGLEGKSIKLMIGEKAMKAIRHWLKYRKETYGVDSEYIFTSWDYEKSELKQINVTTVNSWVDRFGEIIGRKINPHLIRATRATDIVVTEGKDIKFASHLLNHNDSSTTDKFYVIRDEDEDMGDLF